MSIFVVSGGKNVQMCGVVGTGLLRKLGLHGFSLFLSCPTSLLKEAAVLANKRQGWEFPEQGPSSPLLLDALHFVGLILASLDAEGLYALPREEMSTSRSPSSPQFPLSGFLTQDSPPPSHPLKAVPIAVADEGESESEDDDLKPRGNNQQQEELLGQAGHGKHQGLSLLGSSYHGTVGRAAGTQNVLSLETWSFLSQLCDALVRGSMCDTSSSVLIGA